MPQMAMLHEIDPAQNIWAQIGDLSQVDVTGNYVLIGIYFRPEKTKSGLFLSDITRSEDQYQGKAGLVLKLGPKAYQSDDNYQFHESEVCKVGDWVCIFISDGRSIQINGQKCRLVEDQHIRIKIPAPDMVW
jgi:co-chaperonin GroES (HSP10)